MPISEIILTIKNIGSDKDRLRPQQIIDNLQQGLEDLADEGAGVLQVNVGGVAFLPEELTRPDERSRVLELPSHDV